MNKARTDPLLHTAGFFPVTYTIEKKKNTLKGAVFEEVNWIFFKYKTEKLEVSFL